MNRKNPAKIIVAIDSFKGSIDSLEAGEAVAEGIRHAFADLRQSEGAGDIPSSSPIIKVIPLSDGGEGMVKAMLATDKFEIFTIPTTDPLGKKIDATVAKSGDTFLIESAKACGLPLIPEQHRNPAIADSGGVGILLRYAIRSGFGNIIIGLGGSGVNDAGLGMLRELGYRFLDCEGNEIGCGGEALGRLRYIDDSGAIEIPAECSITIASDVKNPLCGEFGASRVFAKQKGADEQMIEMLDKNLHHFAKVVRDYLGYDYSSMEGAGAAGGLGFALMSFLKGRMESGIQTLLNLSHFEDEIKGADFVITGEGRLDLQTLMGKAPYGVMRSAFEKGIPVVGLGGSVDPDAIDALLKSGFTAVLPVIAGPCTLQEAMRKATARENLKRTAYMLIRLYWRKKGCH